MEIERYASSARQDWDAFVSTSKNGTFLFLRDYMDYHADRFHDYSFIVRDQARNPIALFPANRENTVLLSHAGLTYGGFLTDERMKLPLMLEVFEATLDCLHESGIHSIVYKTIPHIYHRVAAEEDVYALFLLNARLFRRDVLAVVNNRYRLAFQERRRRGIRAALRHGLTVTQTANYKEYWPVLIENLLGRHQRLPVHSLDEILLLSSRFPDQIKLFACFEGPAVVAGVVVYVTDRVAHAQYIAASERGRELGALDLLFDHLLNEAYSAMPYFDFGVSTEQNGFFLNRGLNDHKEGFGARVVVHDHYEIPLSSWTSGRLTTPRASSAS